MIKNFTFSFILFSFLVSGIGCTKSPTSPGVGQWAEATSKAFSSGRYGLGGTVFNGQMWAIGGASGPVTTYYSDVYSSGNGSSWTKVNANAPFGGRYGSQVLSYNGQLWLIGGNNSGTLMNDVWSSSDGVTWTQVLAPSAGTATQFTPREDFGALVYNNAMWVIGGFSNGPNNDVWTSINGTNWTEVLADGAGGANQFKARWGLSTVVYNNLMWVIGGAIGNSSDAVSLGYSDVWNSANGSVWTRLSTTATPFGPSHYEQTVVNAENLLAVTGGALDFDFTSISEYEYDTSGDGINWNTGSFPGPARFYHLSLAFDNYVWVIGGCDNFCDSPSCGITYLNDVWYTQ
jgi:leucine-zipper-like transcriptional regulator 1